MGDVIRLQGKKGYNRVRSAEGLPDKAQKILDMIRNNRGIIPSIAEIRKAADIKSDAYVERCLRLIGDRLASPPENEE